MGKKFVLSEADPELYKLAHEAWTDGDKMAVLADRLLEEGKVVGPSEYSLWNVAAAVLADRLLEEGKVVGPSEYSLWVVAAGENDRERGLYELEANVREWIVDLYSDLELRITGGGWPEIEFVVYRNALKAERGKYETTLSEPIELVPGVVRQPRLLRDRSGA